MFYLIIIGGFADFIKKEFCMKNIKSKKYDTGMLLLAVFILSIPVFMSSYILIVDSISEATSEFVLTLYSYVHNISHR